jgi:hypothetical protein
VTALCACDFFPAVMAMIWLSLAMSCGLREMMSLDAV